MKSANCTLICSVNWLGDCCMSMPAIQAWKSLNPNHKLSLLVKPPLIPLWQHHNAIDELIPLDPGHLGPIRTGLKLRSLNFDQVFVFPNSWRAAIPPFVARVPSRTGFPGHTRRMLLTNVIAAPDEALHQQWEYAKILGLPDDIDLPTPKLNLPAPPDDFKKINYDTIIAILPGAARGPAKRWPTKHFIEAAKLLQQSHDCHFILLGTSAEADLCQTITQALGQNATSIAGTTTLPQLAAILKCCKGVLSNDSGGMHLAAAVGTPVVAMFGLTNPKQTGPIGPYTKCLQPPDIRGARKIPRNSSAAEQILASITPQEAADALTERMQSKGSSA